MDMTPPYQLLILPSCYLLRWVVVIQHRPKKITHICVFLTDHQISMKKKQSNHLIFRKQNIS